MTDSKRLPRTPTEAMVDAICRCAVIVDFDADLSAHMQAGAVRAWQAAYDAAPAVRLTRTDPPTEPGWYWGVKPTGDKRYDAVQPVLVRHCHEHPDKILAAYIGWFPDAYQIGGIEWFGPLVALEIAP